MHRPYGVDVAYSEYFKEFESVMASLGGRCHWASCHSWTAVYLSNVFPKWNDFLDLRQQLDPTKLFWNGYLERIFDAQPVAGETLQDVPKPSNYQ